MTDTPSHADLVAGYRAGTARIHVDMSKAMHVCDRDKRLGGGVRAAHHFWKNTGCLLPLVGITLFFFVKWYWAVGAIIAGLLVMSATRKSAAQFVQQHILEDEGFYYDMIEAGVVRVSTL